MNGEINKKCPVCGESRFIREFQLCPIITVVNALIYDNDATWQ